MCCAFVDIIVFGKLRWSNYLCSVFKNMSPIAFWNSLAPKATVLFECAVQIQCQESLGQWKSLIRHKSNSFHSHGLMVLSKSACSFDVKMSFSVLVWEKQRNDFILRVFDNEMNKEILIKLNTNRNHFSGT